ncbi:hypothetical protein [Oerskovia gallyi]|uniref:Ribbon-helix-helix protein, CopG family n=1 Tax=Oerskovia gallyi TaxID=2762226 RepID=A0ABR8UYC7_9CELL|nr:hypothetical protein [Oerskovia gallyi]MBD7997549.1 hypothetical protein [Oerskovia gallyi]
MTQEKMATIKVPVAVRDRLKARAEALHVTQGEALEQLLDESSDENIQTHITEAMDSWSEALKRLA